MANVNGWGTVSVTHIPRRQGNARQSRTQKELAGYPAFVNENRLAQLQAEMMQGTADALPQTSSINQEKK